MRTWTETIELRTWVRASWEMRLIKVIRQLSFADAKGMSLCKFHLLESTDVT